jgi:hypothetical protein
MTTSPRSSVTSEDLKVRVLTAADAPLVATFSCAEADLDDFLRSDALRLQAHRVARTYLSASPPTRPREALHGVHHIDARPPATAPEGGPS